MFMLHHPGQEMVQVYAGLFQAFFHAGATMISWAVALIHAGNCGQVNVIALLETEVKTEIKSCHKLYLMKKFHIFFLLSVVQHLCCNETTLFPWNMHPTMHLQKQYKLC